MTLVDTKPQPAAPRPWHFPTFRRVGDRLIVCDVPGRPLAMASIVFDADFSSREAVCGPPGMLAMLPYYRVRLGQL